MNTHPKNNNENGSGLLSHPEQVSKHGNAYNRITGRVMELLQQGTIPWRKPWNVKRGFYDCFAQIPLFFPLAEIE